MGLISGENFGCAILKVSVHLVERRYDGPPPCAKGLEERPAVLCDREPTIVTDSQCWHFPNVAAIEVTTSNLGRHAGEHDARQEGR